MFVTSPAPTATVADRSLAHGVTSYRCNTPQGGGASGSGGVISPLAHGGRLEIELSFPAHGGGIDME